MEKDTSTPFSNRVSGSAFMSQYCRRSAMPFAATGSSLLSGALVAFLLVGMLAFAAATVVVLSFFFLLAALGEAGAGAGAWVDEVAEVDVRCRVERRGGASSARSVGVLRLGGILAASGDRKRTLGRTLVKGVMSAQSIYGRW